MSIFQKGKITVALLLEWLAFSINPIIFTDLKISIFIAAVVVVMFTPEFEGIDWTTLDTERQKEPRKQGELPTRD